MPKIPSRTIRRTRKPTANRAAQLDLYRFIRNRLLELDRAIEHEIFPVLDRFASPERVDASLFRVDVDILDDRLETLRVLMGEIFVGEEIERKARTVYQRVASKNKTELRSLYGLSFADVGADQIVDAQVRRSVDLIVSLPARQLRRVERTVRGAVGEGLRVEGLRKKLMQQFGATRSQAALIARDQTLKLHGEITKRRQTEAGISQYIWTSSGDDRVRDAHADFEGQIFSWNDPPTDSDGNTGHPGEVFQCRCHAYPVIP